MQLLYLALVVVLIWGAWYTGALTDRSRLSLSQTQMAMWSSLVLALLIVVIVTRALALGGTEGGWEGFILVDISSELLALLGISFGTGVLSVAIKNDKYRRSADLDLVGANEKRMAEMAAAAPDKRYRGEFSELWYAEEGEKKPDLARMQKVVLTFVLGGAYLWMALHFIGDLGQTPIDPQTATVLPNLSESMVTLVALSHTGYLALKYPDHKPGDGKEGQKPPAGDGGDGGGAADGGGDAGKKK